MQCTMLHSMGGWGYYRSVTMAGQIVLEVHREVHERLGRLQVAV